MGKRYVVLGNGIAGFSAADTIRKNDKDAHITIVAAEKTITYSRPLLSKTYFKMLQREKIYIEQHEWYEDNNIKQILGSEVKSIDSVKQNVLLGDGSMLYYDKCIYALGATPFIPPFDGAQKEGVMTVRTVEDFNLIKKRLMLAKKAVVIGGGVIGLEMACEMHKMGCEVTVLEALPRLMGRLLDDESAKYLSQIIEAAGIKTFSGVNIKGIIGSDKAEGVMLADGTVYPADLVLVSCGIRPNVQVAIKSGIDTDRGVLVDRYLNTSIKNIYAAGDCIQSDKPNPGLWMYSKKSGAAAGWNAVYETDQKMFIPSEEAVMLNVLGTFLYSAGAVDAKKAVTTVTKQEDIINKSQFKVNEYNKSKEGYKKLFYNGEKLAGAVLIGDISELTGIKKTLEQNAQMEAGGCLNDAI